MSTISMAWEDDRDSDDQIKDVVCEILDQWDDFGYSNFRELVKDINDTIRERQINIRERVDELQAQLDDLEQADTDLEYIDDNDILSYIDLFYDDDNDALPPRPS